MANAGGRAKFVIQPFKHNQQMDEEYANKTWQTLSNAIHEIHSTARDRSVRVEQVAVEKADRV